MNDRPTADELLAAVQMHLESMIVPAIKADRSLYYQTLVAINVLKVVRRELETGPEHIREEWIRLDELTGTHTPLRGSPEQVQAALLARNAELAEAIRVGEYDAPEKRAALFHHLLATVREKLVVSNPEYLQELLEEDILKG